MPRISDYVPAPQRERSQSFNETRFQSMLQKVLNASAGDFSLQSLSEMLIPFINVNDRDTPEFYYPRGEHLFSLKQSKAAVVGQNSQVIITPNPGNILVITGIKVGSVTAMRIFGGINLFLHPGVNFFGAFANCDARDNVGSNGLSAGVPPVVAAGSDTSVAGVSADMFSEDVVANGMAEVKNFQPIVLVPNTELVVQGGTVNADVFAYFRGYVRSADSRELNSFVQG